MSSQAPFGSTTSFMRRISMNQVISLMHHLRLHLPNMDVYQKSERVLLQVPDNGTLPFRCDGYDFVFAVVLMTMFI